MSGLFWFVGGYATGVITFFVLMLFLHSGSDEE